MFGFTGAPRRHNSCSLRSIQTQRANERPSSSVDFMLHHRRRRRPNIKSTLAHLPVLAGQMRCTWHRPHQLTSPVYTQLPAEDGAYYMYSFSSSFSVPLSPCICLSILYLYVVVRGIVLHHRGQRAPDSYSTIKRMLCAARKQAALPVGLALA